MDTSPRAEVPSGIAWPVSIPRKDPTTRRHPHFADKEAEHCTPASVPWQVSRALHHCFSTAHSRGPTSPMKGQMMPSEPK